MVALYKFGKISLYGIKIMRVEYNNKAKKLC